MRCFIVFVVRAVFLALCLCYIGLIYFVLFCIAVLLLWCVCYVLFFVLIELPCWVSCCYVLFAVCVIIL